MKRRAFTLVELLIVVIILGILAAVVIPQFSDASIDAQFSSLQTNLQTIRGQLELFKLQHNGSYPTDSTTFVDQMTKKTDADGTVNAAGKFGPYLQRMPNNPFTNTNDVTAVVGNLGDDKAWYYDNSSSAGTFKANDGGTTNGIDHNTL